jgi:hypothetical protein
LSFTEWESVMEQLIHGPARTPWNKGKLVGQKAPLKLKDIWAPPFCIRHQPEPRSQARVTGAFSYRNRRPFGRASRAICSTRHCNIGPKNER